jgi:hypothetical protein
VLHVALLEHCLLYTAYDIHPQQKNKTLLLKIQRRRKKKEENMRELIITVLLYVAPYFITWRSKIFITVHISELQ